MTKYICNEAQEIFELQKSKYSPSASPPYQVRIDRLTRIQCMCRENINSITKALQEDFGTRHPDLIRTYAILIEIVGL